MWYCSVKGASPLHNSPPTLAREKAVEGGAKEQFLSKFYIDAYKDIMNGKIRKLDDLDYTGHTAFYEGADGNKIGYSYQGAFYMLNSGDRNKLIVASEDWNDKTKTDYIKIVYGFWT
jgi:hypothetical protein